MKDDTKRIKKTNQALKGLFFEGSPLGEIADVMVSPLKTGQGIMEPRTRRKIVYGTQN